MENSGRKRFYFFFHSQFKKYFYTFHLKLIRIPWLKVHIPSFAKVGKSPGHWELTERERLKCAAKLGHLFSPTEIDCL